MTMKGFGGAESEDNASKYDFRWGWDNVGRADHKAANPWFTELTTSLLELGLLWKKYIPREKPGETGSDDAQHLLLLEVVDILSVIQARTWFYRRSLFFGMSAKAYRKTLIGQKALGLSVSARKSMIERRLVGTVPSDASLRQAL
jgi:hypothetical protein